MTESLTQVMHSDATTLVGRAPASEDERPVAEDPLSFVQGQDVKLSIERPEDGEEGFPRLIVQTGNGGQYEREVRSTREAAAMADFQAFLTGLRDHSPANITLLALNLPKKGSWDHYRNLFDWLETAMTPRKQAEALCAADTTIK